MFAGEEEPIDQNRIPWCYVDGQRSDQVLKVTDLEAWSAERAKRCGHTDDRAPACRMCRGTELVEAMVTSSGYVRLLRKS